MKRTADGRWCHLLCAMWMPGVGFANPAARDIIEGTDQIEAARKRLNCTVCRQPYGACIQCAGGKSCCRAFHPLCARDAGFAMIMEVSKRLGRPFAQIPQPPVSFPCRQMTMFLLFPPAHQTRSFVALTGG